MGSMVSALAWGLLMVLDLGKLELVKNRGDKIIARCPACAKTGGDKAGEHLVIFPDGRFGCVVYSGERGVEHRRWIVRLVGVGGPYCWE